MRKNKRRKKRLKTALILLIILFILAGFGGMLFVSHKNKIEKEQRKEAALAALDSIPENYQGTWYREDGLTTIDIYDISLKSVSFTYKRINGKNHSLSVEADVTAEVAGNATQFYLKDSDGNKAKGEFVFDKSGEFYVKVKTYKRADGSLTYPKTESIMTREAPAEDAGSTEQENAGTEAASDTSDAETSSGSSTEVNSTDAENASDANAYYSESEDTSSQDDTGIYGIPYGEEETYYTE